MTFGGNMGFLKTLFNEIIKAGQETMFTPDFNKSEYDNCLEFVSQGGTSEQWEYLKRTNNWAFKKSKAEVFAQYEKEVEYVSAAYFNLLQKIQKDWSVLYNTNNYLGMRANAFEKACLQGIDYYKRMREIDQKYGQSTPTANVPAFTRLAMLYEKQERFEDSVSICKQAISLGIDERSRMIRMIKKSGRTSTTEEMKMLDI